MDRDKKVRTTDPVLHIMEQAEETEMYEPIKAQCKEAYDEGCINPFWEDRGCSQINESKIRSPVHSRAKSCRHGSGGGGGWFLDEAGL